MKPLLSVIAACLACSTAMALETSAGAQSVNTSQFGLAQRLESYSTIMETMFNKMLTCNNKGMIFNSDPSATVVKDADGCVGTSADMTNMEVYQETKTVDLPGHDFGAPYWSGDDPYSGAKLPNTIDLKAVVPDGTVATNIYLTLDAFRQTGKKEADPPLYHYEIPLSSLNGSSTETVILAGTSKSGDRLLWTIANGVVSNLQATGVRSFNPAAIGNVKLKYDTFAVRKKAGS